MAHERRAFYIDGFNLFFGLKASGWKNLYWLDIQKLCERLLQQDQTVSIIRYFTARITGHNPARRLRQKTYLQALETLPLVSIHYGLYFTHTYQCRNCGYSYPMHSEKKSDVNLAVSIITDAMDNLYDTAVLISGDSDLTPPLEAIRKYFPFKKIVLFSPPNRHSKSLQNACHSFGGALNKGILEKCQFPDTVTNKRGFPIHRPEYWTRTGKKSRDNQ